MERGLCDGNRKSSFLLQAVQRDASPDSRLSLQIQRNVRYLNFITVCVCVCVRVKERVHNQACFLDSPPFCVHCNGVSVDGGRAIVALTRLQGSG